MSGYRLVQTKKSVFKTMKSVFKTMKIVFQTMKLWELAKNIHSLSNCSWQITLNFEARHLKIRSETKQTLTKLFFEFQWLQFNSGPALQVEAQVLFTFLHFFRLFIARDAAFSAGFSSACSAAAIDNQYNSSAWSFRKFYAKICRYHCHFCFKQ